MMTEPRKDYGPNQLADYIGTWRANIARARLWNLIPEPDRAGGKKWSAAAAGQILARWPEILPELACIGAPGLKERGWTEAMIRDLLGEPDDTADNPHYKSAAPRRLWRLRKVEAAEAGPEFAARRERAERQSASAAKGVVTKRAWQALGGYNGQWPGATARE